MTIIQKYNSLNIKQKAKLLMTAIWIWMYMIYYYNKCMNFILSMAFTYTPDSIIYNVYTFFEINISNVKKHINPILTDAFSIQEAPADSGSEDDSIDKDPSTEETVDKESASEESVSDGPKEEESKEANHDNESKLEKKESELEELKEDKTEEKKSNKEKNNAKNIVKPIIIEAKNVSNKEKITNKIKLLIKLIWDVDINNLYDINMTRTDSRQNKGLVGGLNIKDIITYYPKISNAIVYISYIFDTDVSSMADVQIDNLDKKIKSILINFKDKTIYRNGNDVLEKILIGDIIF